MENNIAIRISNLGHAYRADEWVFRHLNLEIEKGKVCSILGPNGCGKTTMLKSILHLLTPNEGGIEIDGEAAFVPQLFNAGFDFSVRDMVIMGRAKKIGLFSLPSKEDEQVALEALKRVGMLDYVERSFHELSGGQRQLVILARALSSGADTLILDEPTSALDLKNQDFVLHYIHKLSYEDGLTIVFTSHHPHHALAIADKVLLMLPDGCVYAPTQEALSEENMHLLYGINMKCMEFEYRGLKLKSIFPVYY
jgi:iron complex transport system ATP-binding protein